MINPNLFPIPETYYSQPTLGDVFSPLSIFALNLQLTQAPGNLLKNELKKGHYYFRDSLVPTPRPATFRAWERISRLGGRSSERFLVPFLPSLRDDDEISSATSERGARISSLSRRSALHIRDSTGRILWGSVYLGELARDADADSILIGESHRSNFTESLILKPAQQEASTAQMSIRSRMEFLASHGFLGVADFCFELRVPWVNRVLFQFLNQQAAAKWALEYNRVHFLVQKDPLSQVSDYKDMIQALQLARVTKVKDDESTDSEPAKTGGKNIPMRDRFGAAGDIDFL